MRGNQLKRYIPRIEYIDGKDQDKHGYYFILWFLQGNIRRIQFSAGKDSGHTGTCVIFTSVIFLLSIIGITYLKGIGIGTVSIF